MSEYAVNAAAADKGCGSILLLFMALSVLINSSTSMKADICKSVRGLLILHPAVHSDERV